MAVLERLDAIARAKSRSAGEKPVRRGTVHPWFGGSGSWKRGRRWLKRHQRSPVTERTCPRSLWTLSSVAYNSRQCLRACVEPLVGIPGVSILVVDNACPERSFELVDDLAGVQVIHTARNGGFAYGCNCGLASQEARRGHLSALRRESRRGGWTADALAQLSSRARHRTAVTPGRRSRRPRLRNWRGRHCVTNWLVWPLLAVARGYGRTRSSTRSSGTNGMSPVTTSWSPSASSPSPSWALCA